MAFYGPKPKPLETLIARVQGLAASHLPGFRPRPMPEVHATLLGLEDPARAADLPLLLRHLTAALHRPGMSVQFGGFADREYPISSRDRGLHERSFLVSDANVVLIGWPVDGRSGEPTPALDDLRRSCQAFGFRHRYHLCPGDTDPDCYLVVGRTPGGSAPAHVTVAETAIRNELAASPPTRISLTTADVRLVRYSDTTLPTGTSRAYPIDRPHPPH
ncbi:hypothetical protein JCM9534A_23220 [Catenuloplanes indicus JCM 9534]